jgi:hypothetical protein
MISRVGCALLFRESFSAQPRNLSDALISPERVAAVKIANYIESCLYDPTRCVSVDGTREDMGASDGRGREILVPKESRPWIEDWIS